MTPDEHDYTYEEDDEETENDEDADEEEADEEGEGTECYVLEIPESMSPPPLRLVRLRTGEKPDPREAIALPLLHYARGAATLCPARACRAAGICQSPPLKCRLRPYAEVHSWDEGLPNGGRREMYTEIRRKIVSGSTRVCHFPAELKRFTPNLPAGAIDEETTPQK